MRPDQNAETDTQPEAIPEDPQELVVWLTGKFSQSFIEEKTGVSQATISRIGSGTSKDPKSSTVKALRTFAQEHGQQAA